jgi:nucleotide-binding universal stress UspA family protein
MTFPPLEWLVCFGMIYTPQARFTRFEKRKEKVMRVEIKTIFCATDISDFSNHAVSWGIALAQEFSAKLYVCHVVDFPTSITYGDGPIFFVDQQSQAISNANHQLKQLVGDKKVQWEPLVTIGHAGDEISRLAKEKGADLAISATHGRSGLKRLILGSVTERLMRTLHCPLLIVRGPKHDLNILSEQGVRFNKILVGCDFSEDSALAFQHGLSLAQEFQSELHLVHVMEPLVYMDTFKISVEYGEDLQVDLQTQIKDKLQKMVPTEAFHWCTPKTALLDGPSHEELIRYAKINKMDLIVLGVRGQGVVERLFIGSTTDRVVRQTPCPVLSVCMPE